MLDKGMLMKKRYLLLILIILSLASIFIGVMDVNIQDILQFDEEQLQILILSRLPRLMSIIVAGMGMSISGLIMQQISRNKFVSPTTAATVDSAKLGILVSMVLFSGSSTLYFCHRWDHVIYANIKKGKV